MRTKFGLKGGCRHGAAMASARPDPDGTLVVSKPSLLLAEHP